MENLNNPKLFPVVAIGASAGGLKAFTDLLSALPPAPGKAFVLYLGNCIWIGGVVKGWKGPFGVAR